MLWSRVGLFVCSNIVDELSVLSKIRNILLLSEVFLLLKDYESMFIEQVHAYKLFDKASQHVWIVNKNNLSNISLFDAQMSLCLKHPVEIYTII